LNKRVFMEISVPSAVLRAWPTVTKLGLCTAWDPAERGDVMRWATGCIDGVHNHAPYDMFHPVKRAHGTDWAIWNQLFDRLSATKS